jgi:trehalose 6-phosphate synthase
VTDGTSGHLILLHDLTFAEQRSAQARPWITIALAAVVLIGAALASILALLIVRRRLQSIRRAVDDVKAGRNGGFNDDPAPESTSRLPAGDASLDIQRR